MTPNVDPRGGTGQASDLPLDASFPRLRQRVRRLPLADLPTPVERLPIDDRDTWIKRDDLTGRLYGGNKVRKLEFLLPAARAAGAERLITVGAIGSHHALATTLYGKRAGFDVSVVLLPQTPTEHVREVLDSMRALGADVRLTRSAATVPAGVLAARFAHRAQHPYLVPAGGSDPLGTLGFVNAALELARQCEAGECVAPAEVHVAGGTLGTAGGLALGFAVAGLPTRVVAHRITSRAITNGRRARRLVRGTLALLAEAGGERHLPAERDVLRRLSIRHEQIGRGYGFDTPAAHAALEWFRGAVRIELDLTYTAKAAAGFLDDVRSGRARTPALYWHTLSAVPAAGGGAAR